MEYKGTKKYYEAEELLEFVRQHTPHINGETAMECVESAIKEAPAADAVEVVRCKDCVHKVELHGRVMCGRAATTDGNLILGLVATCAEDFCSCGTREGGEG